MSRVDMYSKNTSIGRQSEHEQSIVKSILNANLKKKSKILILGATPELRNPALDLGHSLVTLDIDLEMIYKRQKVMKYQYTEDEIIVKGNWLSPWYMKENLFDAILADASFNNLTQTQMIYLFKICKRLLKKKGLLVFRHFSFNRIFSIPKLISMYRNKGIDEREFGLSLFTNKELKRSYVDRQVNVAESLNAMIKVMKKEKFPRHEIEFYENHRWKGNWLIMEQKDFEKNLRKEFGTFRKHISKNIIYSCFSPIYEISVKN